MPNVYVYAANNPSESILAKRRGYGTIISHNVPPYARSVPSTSEFPVSCCFKLAFMQTFHDCILGRELQTTERFVLTFQQQLYFLACLHDVQHFTAM